MNITKISFPLFTLWLVNIFLWCILVPIASLFSTEDDIIWKSVKILFLVFVTVISYYNLKTIAEPYEIDRIKRYYKIATLLFPKMYIAVIFLFGYAIISIVSHVADGEFKVMVMLFGVLFIILALRWWSKDIEYVRIPKGDTL